MDGLLQILVLVAFLLAGGACVRLKLAPSRSLVDRLIKLVLWVLLFSMGFRLGGDPALASRLGAIGLLAAATALLSVAGTLVAIVVTFRVFSVPDHIADASGGPARFEISSLKAPGLLLAIVVFGFVAGALLPSGKGFDLSASTGWVLDILLFFIGMQFAQAGISLKNAFLRKEAILLPGATILGTLAGGLVLVPLFGLSAGKALALAGGFGWYTLSGVLISDLGDPALGSAAFLANMFRETIALVSIPFLARTRIPLLAVGAGGATAMDVTLPLIEQSTGPWIVPISFASGAILSLLVPFLVPLFFKLG